MNVRLRDARRVHATAAFVVRGEVVHNRAPLCGAGMFRIGSRIAVTDDPVTCPMCKVLGDADAPPEGRK